MSKIILYKDSARKALEQGIDILAKAVAVTIGPKGRNVVIQKNSGFPQIVNDGVTIAKEIQLQNLIQNMGVSLIRQAACKTNDVAGDGTTTATVLAHSIVKQGLQNVTLGSSPIALKRGINKAVKFLVYRISECSRPVNNIDDITQVASISAGNDHDIGLVIAKAIKQVGKEGVIVIEESQSTLTHVEIHEGMEFNKGFISPYFITDSSTMGIVYDNPYILLTDKKIILTQRDLVPILEQVSKTDRPLLIIAEDIEKDALATLIINKLRGIVNVVAVRAPGFGDRKKALLEDIAILTSGQVITDYLGLSLSNISLSQLGVAKKVKITKDVTTIVANTNDLNIRARCNQIRHQLEASNNNYEKEKLQERLSKLVGGVAVIKVGAVTEVEMKDKKLRLEDAINATRAALEEGIIPGGGSTLVHLAKDLFQWSIDNLNSEELVGALLVHKSLSLPLQLIAKNAGENSAVVLEKVSNSAFEIGYNANNGHFDNMYQLGIIDSAKVIRSALQNAASIASILLTTECIIL